MERAKPGMDKVLWSDQVVSVLPLPLIWLMRSFDERHHSNQVYVLRSFINARSNGSAAIKGLLDSPSIFPFRLAHISAEHVASLSLRLNILRHGLDDDLVMLREVHGERKGG